MNIKIVKNLSQAELTGELVGFDVETTITQEMDKLAVVQVYQESNDTCYVVPIRTKTLKESPEDFDINKNIIKTLRRVGHYLQFDLAEVLYHYGEMPTPVGDTFLVACMLQWKHKGLKTISKVFCPESESREIEDVIDLTIS